MQELRRAGAEVVFFNPVLPASLCVGPISFRALKVDGWGWEKQGEAGQRHADGAVCNGSHGHETF